MNAASGRTFVIRILKDPEFKAFEESCAKDPDRLPSIEIGSLPIDRRIECGFRGKAAVDSDAFQPLIPTQPSHRFRLKPATA